MDAPVEVGSLLIHRVIPDSLWRENTYIVHDQDSGATLVIDPSGPTEPIRAILDRRAVAPAVVLLTHAHHDHVSGLAELARSHPCPCLLHRSDLRLLRHAPMYSVMFDRRKIETPGEVTTFEAPPAVTLGALPVETLFTPGHTAGSVSYRIGEAVFTGDTLFVEHIGRSDLPGADPRALIGSVDRLLADLPEHAVLFAGHGRSWDVGTARRWWGANRENAPAYKALGPRPMR